MRINFADDFKVVLGNSLCETALSNSTAYPASGSYVDVSGYEDVNVNIHLGTQADAVVFTMKQTDGVSGSTLDTIDSSLCKKTIATTDDGQAINFHIETAKLAKDHHFLTCYITAVSGSDYADILYFLGGARHQPVTQASAVMPSDNQLDYSG